MLGIGVNVGAAPHEGSVSLGPGVDRAELLAELLLRLERAFDAWDATRRARSDDGALIVSVFREAREAQGMSFPPPEHERGFLDRILALETWIVGDDAFMALGDDVLDYIYVRPEAQSRGIGSSLIALAKQRRPDGFRLWVFQHLERSRRFYERHGLELVELTDGSGNMERLPDALYAWTPPTAPTASR